MKPILTKSIFFLMLITSPIANASFECKNADNTLQVLLQHEDLQEGFANKGKPAEALVSLDGEQIFTVTGNASKIPTRTGSSYYYQLALQDVKAHIYEYVHLLKKPSCHHGGRVECDYFYNSKYSGSITFNGQSHDLVCKVI